MATKAALKLGDYAVTEAGFGADLGAEKFLDIKCRMADIHPDAVVVVATVRALKHHGGVAKADLGTENLEALEKGLPNLLRHVENITKVFGLPCVVAINRFPLDTEAELALIEAKCKELGVNVALSEGVGQGGRGAVPWPRKWSACVSSPTTSARCTTWTPPSRRSSTPSSPRSTGAGMWSSPRRPESRPPSSRRRGMATTPSAWPRPSTASPTTPSCWARRRTSPSPCGT